MYFRFVTLYLLTALAEILPLGIVRRRVVDSGLSVVLRNAVPLLGRGPFHLAVGRLRRRRCRVVATAVLLGLLTRELLRRDVAVDLGRRILLLLVGGLDAALRLRELRPGTVLLTSRGFLRPPHLRLLTLLSFTGAIRRARTLGRLRARRDRRRIKRPRGGIRSGELDVRVVRGRHLDGVGDGQTRRQAAGLGQIERVELPL